MKFLKVGLIFSAFALFIFACNQAANTNNTTNNAANNNKNVAQTNLPATTPNDELALGKTAYKENCAKCHKDDGTGGKITIEGKTINPDNLTTDKQKNKSDEKYVEFIENGFPEDGMPAFKGRLTDAQIKQIIKYVRTEFQSK
ncbi:hypothetical protein BH10ACI1_BH10ACI1_22590 [soil metagenome]